MDGRKFLGCSSSKWHSKRQCARPPPSNSLVQIEPWNWLQTRDPREKVKKGTACVITSDILHKSCISQQVGRFSIGSTLRSSCIEVSACCHDIEGKRSRLGGLAFDVSSNLGPNSVALQGEWSPRPCLSHSKMKAPYSRSCGKIHCSCRKLDYCKP
jgi:hypothetical protein